MKFQPIVKALYCVAIYSINQARIKLDARNVYILWLTRRGLENSAFDLQKNSAHFLHSLKQLRIADVLCMHIDSGSGYATLHHLSYDTSAYKWHKSKLSLPLRPNYTKFCRFLVLVERPT